MCGAMDHPYIDANSVAERYLNHALSAAELREFAFKNMQVRPADSARAHTQQYITRPNHRFADVFNDKRTSRRFENRCSHKPRERS